MHHYSIRIYFFLINVNTRNRKGGGNSFLKNLRTSIQEYCKMHDFPICCLLLLYRYLFTELNDGSYWVANYSRSVSNSILSSKGGITGCFSLSCSVSRKACPTTLSSHKSIARESTFPSFKIDINPSSSK